MSLIGEVGGESVSEHSDNWPSPNPFGEFNGRVLKMKVRKWSNETDYLKACSPRVILVATTQSFSSSWIGINPFTILFHNDSGTWFGGSFGTKTGAIGCDLRRS